jgi:hypothetical protein
MYFVIVDPATSNNVLNSGRAYLHKVLAFVFAAEFLIEIAFSFRHVLPSDDKQSVTLVYQIEEGGRNTRVVSTLSNFQ